MKLFRPVSAWNQKIHNSGQCIAQIIAHKPFYVPAIPGPTEAGWCITISQILNALENDKDNI